MEINRFGSHFQKCNGISDHNANAHPTHSPFRVRLLEDPFAPSERADPLDHQRRHDQNPFARIGDGTPADWTRSVSMTAAVANTSIRAWQPRFASGP